MLRLEQSVLVALVFTHPIGAAQLHGQATQSSPPGAALESTIPRLAVPLSVEQAEREGASFPRYPESDSLRGMLLSQYPGSPARNCVRPDPNNAGMRTGDIAIGASIHRLMAGKGDKIWIATAHDPTRERLALLVRAVRLTNDLEPSVPDTLRIVNLSYAYAAPPPPAPNRGVSFFPSRSFMLPKAGDWLLIATAGSDWGCIILTVR
jgi:hypothetical protein